MKLAPYPPLSVGAAAVYPYSEELLEWAAKTTKYGDEYSLARVVGVGDHKRIWLPRALAPSITVDMREKGEWYEFNSNFVPRNEEQTRVIKETVERLKTGENFLMECPTAFGKTFCSMDIIAKVGKKTIVIVTKEDIRDQWIAAAKAVLGLTLEDGLGLIQGDTCNVAGKGLVIAMVQSVAKESRYPMHVFQGFGLALWDEAHRVGADYFSQSCYRIPARLRLGVSATPDRRDGKTQVIEAHIGKVKVSSTRATTTPKVLLKTSPWQIPLVKVKDKDGNLVTAQMPHSPMNCGHVIRMLSRHHGRNEMIRNFVTAAYKKGRVTLVQSDRLEHLEQLTAMFVGNGIPASDIGHYASGLTTSERELIKKKRIIVATYQMTAEATDIPELDTLVMGTPKSDVIQIVGRILREHPDKKDPLVFDIVDDSSSLFTGYARNRQKWYKEIGAPIDRL